MKHKRLKAFLLCAMITAAILIHPITGGAAVACSHGGDGCGETVISSRFLGLIKERGSARVGRGTQGKALLIPSGSTFGVRISGSGVRITHTGEGESPFLENDRIDKINGARVYTTEQVKAAVSASDGREMRLDIIRDGRHMTLRVCPRLIGAEYSLGVIISDGACGIGTITYIDPSSGEFGGLGHGICDPKSGEVLNMTEGEATTVILGGAVRGAAGAPGELRGVLTDKIIGSIDANTECGVFGRLTDAAVKSLTESSTAYEIGTRRDLREGEATILSTVKNGRCAEYSIRIEDIDRTASGTKCFRIRVTDEALTALTGGIVRGMSGSPIIQDGKLVGAVTHVLVADPTEGYGIFIENMLSAANEGDLPQAA